MEGKINKWKIVFSVLKFNSFFYIFIRLPSFCCLRVLVSESLFDGSNGAADNEMKREKCARYLTLTVFCISVTSYNSQQNDYIFAEAIGQSLEVKIKKNAIGVGHNIRIQKIASNAALRNTKKRIENKFKCNKNILFEFFAMPSIRLDSSRKSCIGNSIKRQIMESIFS